jgi:serine/threonine protein kinase
MSAIPGARVIKQLGRGEFGTTYLVEYNGGRYAMKIERILPHQARPGLQSRVWREIEFATTVANAHGDYFIQLVHHDIIDDCKHKQRFSSKPFNDKEARERQALAASPFCARRIWTLVDTTLATVIDKLTMNARLSIGIQLLNIIALLNSKGYRHNDLHLGNIGLIRTRAKTIRLTTLRKTIPTHGYQVKLIDFGLVTHKKYKLTAVERRGLDDYFAETSSVFNVVYWSNLNDFIRKRGIKLSWPTAVRRFKGSELQARVTQYSDRLPVQTYLAYVRYPDEYNRLILRDEHPARPIAHRHYLPMTKIEQMMSNHSNPARLSDILLTAMK